MTHHASHHQTHTIGPNAVTQLVTAMQALGFEDRIENMFLNAHAADWFLAPPQNMVDETRVAHLHHAVRQDHPSADSSAILKRAGELTGAYILAHRIPGIAQIILKILPKSLAAKFLTKAILAHAWTFAGSGHVSVRHAKKNIIVLEIVDNPLCRLDFASDPVCIWHEAVLTTLYRALVSKHAVVKEVDCAASGGNACIFNIRY